MKVRWSGEANRDALAIEEFLSERSVRHARSVFARIRSRTKELSLHPRIGRPGKVDGTRELVIPNTPFIIVYRTGSDEILVLRLIHGAQRWPPADGSS